MAVKTVTIADNEIDPEVWGKAYPSEYELWKKTGEPTTVAKSVYKRGWDADKVVYDKLSEFPYMALLFNGWGFGVEYNEPRGHSYMLVDQQEVDPSRVKEVIPDPDNSQTLIGVITKSVTGQDERRYRTILNGDEMEILSPAAERMRADFTDGCSNVSIRSPIS